MKKNIKLISAIIFYGSIWGILEATLGYVLHFVPVLISGSILFPLASLLMVRLYKQTNSTSSVFYASVLAALLKSINFLLPNLSIWKVINPMIAILIEGTVLVLAFSFMKQKNTVLSVSMLVLTPILWRTLYIGVFGLELAFFDMFSPLIASTSEILTFVIQNGLIGGILVLGLYLLNQVSFSKLDFKVSHSPLFAASMFVLAFVLTILPILG